MAIRVFFASGPNPASRLGDFIFTYEVPVGTASSGSVKIPGSALAADPEGTKHIVAASAGSESFSSLLDVELAYGRNANRAVVLAAMKDAIKTVSVRQESV